MAAGKKADDKEISEKQPEHDICQIFFGGQDISCFRDMVSGKRTSKIQQQTMEDIR